MIGRNQTLVPIRTPTPFAIARYMRQKTSMQESMNVTRAAATKPSCRTANAAEKTDRRALTMLSSRTPLCVSACRRP